MFGRCEYDVFYGMRAAQDMPLVDPIKLGEECSDIDSILDCIQMWNGEMYETKGSEQTYGRKYAELSNETIDRYFVPPSQDVSPLAVSQRKTQVGTRFFFRDVDPIISGGGRFVCVSSPETGRWIITTPNLEMSWSVPEFITCSRTSGLVGAYELMYGHTETLYGSVDVALENIARTLVLCLMPNRPTTLHFANTLESGNADNLLQIETNLYMCRDILRTVIPKITVVDCPLNITATTFPGNQMVFFKKNK